MALLDSELLVTLVTHNKNVKHKEISLQIVLCSRHLSRHGILTQPQNVPRSIEE